MRKVEFTSTPAFDFHELMLHRVHEILMVASPYDAYAMEEDGQLSEQILTEYLEMNFSAAPRVTRKSTAAEALSLITKRKFDLVIVMTRISDMDPISFGAQVKAKYPKKPVILLAADESELIHLPVNDPDSPIDRTFIWTGNSNVFAAIIKFVEDKLNASRDVRKAGVRIIIVIEDTPRDYSVILPLIYQVIINYTNQLISKSLNAAQRFFHLRGRPKILLTSNFEEAQKYYKRYQNNLLGIISDINFPKGGKKNPQAGLLFTQWVRKQDPVMPIMLQSRDEDVRDLANSINAHFLYKKSSRLLRDIEEFVIRNFGFGNFIFRMPDGEGVAMAATIKEFSNLLKTVPDESFNYHASHNHFSNWLAARGEFGAANKIRPLRVTDFPDTDEHRRIILDFIASGAIRRRVGSLFEFTQDSFNPDINLYRLAGGSIGGKARGLAFAEKILEESEIQSKYHQYRLRVPRVAVIGTDEFDQFMNRNSLWERVMKTTDNREIDQAFLEARLSRVMQNKLKVYLSQIFFPLAIRSSSLLEDSPYQSLAGAYATYMFPNNDGSLNRRVQQLCDLIKLVFASMFHNEPRALIANSTYRLEEEKMAVIIQEMIGSDYHHYFYPTFSGVAQNLNYYPVSYMKREEGVVFLALGLGRTIVEGERALRFSPVYPAILPQFYSIKATLDASQNHFYALDMNKRQRPKWDDQSFGIKRLPLKQAENDGSLKFAGSVISAEDAVVRDSLHYVGTRIVTFAPILKWKQFPLVDIINELLDVGLNAFGGPVELEFAVNLPVNKKSKAEFALLQIRPMHYSNQETSIDLEDYQREGALAASSITLGNGIIDDLQNIIVVDKDNFNPSKTQEIAAEIGELNQRVGQEGNYILIGPGRWGSADPWLGIPVRWDQISNAKVIVEVGIDKFNIDPSFGSHFFQVVTGSKIAYFTINPKNSKDFLNWNWLKKMNTEYSSEYLRWIKLPHPADVHIDGVSGTGIIYQQVEKSVLETMDEMESTGI